MNIRAKRHRLAILAVELGARSAIRRELARDFPQWAGKLGEDALIDLSGLGRISETAMTRDTEIIVEANGLPSTFVPGRNLLFLAYAGALAYRKSAGAIVAGMCEADFSGYPDCRRDTLDAQMIALRLGMEADFTLETPLMSIDKAESWRLAERLGGSRLVELVNEYSHTCYRGVRGTRHPWGYGCGDCPACALRRKGWETYAAGEAA
ncbi:MAG: 7-cyano-7-deazaguanine synthase [Pseudomonadota bacterium]